MKNTNTSINTTSTENYISSEEPPVQHFITHLDEQVIEGTYVVLSPAFVGHNYVHCSCELHHKGNLIGYMPSVIIYSPADDIPSVPVSLLQEHIRLYLDHVDQETWSDIEDIIVTITGYKRTDKFEAWDVTINGFQYRMYDVD